MNHGQLAILNPLDGTRTDYAVTGGLPTTVAYGGAWFNASGRLFLYRNNGQIYELDVSVPTAPAIIGSQSGPDSLGRNDAAACIQQTVYVSIDIKPGSNPNCFNNNGNGVIPVAVLGSADFDVTQIVVDDTLAFASLLVNMKGNGNLQCSIKDVSGDFSQVPEGEPDGYLDLVCQFEDQDGQWEAGSHEACVAGHLNEGRMFVGCDTACVTQ